MQPASPLSPYLVRTPAKGGRLERNRNRWRMLSWHRPRLKARTVLGLALWGVIIVTVVGGGQTARDVQAHLPAAVRGGGAALAAAEAPAPTPMASLPAGPTGGLVAPGTLAAANTYANSYARGQCTWYVAGRRQVPTNWGNANTWYARARAAGWSVGTTPAVGAIAQTTAGRYGHVALVTAIDGDRVFVEEMNYRAAYVASSRWVAASAFRYIY